MEERILGSQGLRVSAIGLGCMGMSEGYGPIDIQECRKTLEHAVDLGVTLFDTADVYGCGENERFLGKVLRGVRNQVAIATKVGLLRSPEGKYYGLSGRPDYILRACEESLIRLSIDTIDLLYLHRTDRKVPIEETVGAMADLVKQGKVRFLGLSEVGPDTLRRAHAAHPISALQSEYSLWSREMEDRVLPLCRQLGIGFVAYCPLGRGFLTGKVTSVAALGADDCRVRIPRFNAANLGRNLALLESLQELTRGKKCTLGQLALAWLLARDEHIVPIPGMRTRAHLRENLGAFDLSLTASDMEMIETVFSRSAVAGKRYSEFALKFVDV